MDSTLIEIVQSEASRYIKESWAISPTSVYGFLIAFMLLIILLQGVVIVLQNKKNEAFENKLTGLLAQNIAVIEAFTNKFDGDGRELEAVRFKDSIRGVMQQELAGIQRQLEKLN